MFWYLFFLFISSILGIVALVSAFLGVRTVIQLRRHGRRVHGTVIDTVQKGSGKSTVWVPIVGFTDHLGYPVEFALWEQTRCKWRVGQDVPVIYLPDNPQNACGESWARLVFSAVALFVMGTGFLATAVGVVLKLTAKAGM